MPDLPDDAWTFSTDAVRKLSADHRELLAIRRLIRPDRRRIPHVGPARIGPTLPWYNEHASTCPAYGVVAINGVHTKPDGTSIALGTRPSTSWREIYEFNGAAAVDPNEIGTLQTWPVVIGAAGGAPGIDTNWGPKDASWLLWTATGNVYTPIVGVALGTYDAGNNWGLFQRREIYSDVFWGTVYADFTTGASEFDVVVIKSYTRGYAVGAQVTVKNLSPTGGAPFLFAGTTGKLARCAVRQFDGVAEADWVQC